MPKSENDAMSELTHIDQKGRATMIDVGSKPETRREAIARGSVYMKKETLSLITGKGVAKGNVFETARLAGIMAAKKTCDLIPLCHQLNLSSVVVDLKADTESSKVEIQAKARCTSQTGVEMEALTAVSVAALTIYDMCKAVDRRMVISEIMLLEKRGGKSGDWKR